MVGILCAYAAAAYRKTSIVVETQWDASVLTTVLKADGSAASAEGDVVSQWTPAVGTVSSTYTWVPLIDSATTNRIQVVYSLSNNKWGIRSPLSTLLNLPSAANSISASNRCTIFAMRWMALPSQNFSNVFSKFTWGTAYASSYGLRIPTASNQSLYLGAVGDTIVGTDALVVGKLYVCVLQMNSAGGIITRLFPSSDATLPSSYPSLGGFANSTYHAWTFGGITDGGRPNYTCDIVLHEVRWYTTTAATATVSNIMSIVTELYAKWS